MRICVLADVHANRDALEAVLADLGRRGGADRIVNLGDCVSGPLWPAETLRRLRSLDAVTVRGNHDRHAACYPETGGVWDALAAETLAGEDRAWLGALPVYVEVAPGIVACHGAPGDDDSYLIERVADGRLERDAPAAITARLGPASGARLVLCGHSHRPDLIRLPSGETVLNPGSVGCPAYRDPVAPAHVQETGAPHARYAMVELGPDGALDATFRAVPYDPEPAVARALVNGQPGWARVLRSGYLDA